MGTMVTLGELLTVMSVANISSTGYVAEAIYLTCIFTRSRLNSTRSLPLVPSNTYLTILSSLRHCFATVIFHNEAVPTGSGCVDVLKDKVKLDMTLRGIKH